MWDSPLPRVLRIQASLTVTLRVPDMSNCAGAAAAGPEGEVAVAQTGSEIRPWNTAGLKHWEWLEVYTDSVKRWGATLDAVEDHFDGDPLLDGYRELVRQEREAFADHLRVCEGDRETCRRISRRLGDLSD